MEISIINTHTPGAIFLKYQYRVSQPLRVKNFNDEPGRQEPGHLFSNRLAPFLVKPVKILLDRFCLWVNIKMVLSEFSRHTRHVRRFPCEDVPILTDEFDERAFLFGIQTRPNGELLG